MLKTVFDDAKLVHILMEALGQESEDPTAIDWLGASWLVMVGYSQVRVTEPVIESAAACDGVRSRAARKAVPIATMTSILRTA
jgi:hypothetical protein